MRTTVSGKSVLLSLGLGVLALITVVYWCAARLKMGGVDALKAQPSPARDAGSP